MKRKKTESEKMRRIKVKRPAKRTARGRAAKDQAGRIRDGQEEVRQNASRRGAGHPVELLLPPSRGTQRSGHIKVPGTPLPRQVIEGMPRRAASCPYHQKQLWVQAQGELLSAFDAHGVL